MHRRSFLIDSKPTPSETGPGIATDEAEAARPYKLAANQNDASTQYGYAVCLANGRGVVKDQAEAAGHFKLADDQNHPLAQYDYAVCLATGQALQGIMPRLLDITNSPPTRIMHRPNSRLRFAVRRGRAL
jgi:TPR repeat protein